jgi:hypothetical protein
MARDNADKIKGMLKKMKLEDSSESEEEEASDGENLKYFLDVLGMGRYFEGFKANKVTSLPQLRSTPS